MTFEITFLDSQPNGDVVDYFFRVSKGQSVCTVKVFISGPAKLWKNLSRDELIKAATDWLRFGLDRGKCDPFSHPETDSTIGLIPAALDHWVEHRLFQTFPA
jgi:hypothetical protein